MREEGIPEEVVERDMASGSRTGGVGGSEGGGERADWNHLENWVRGLGSRWVGRRRGEWYWLCVVSLSAGVDVWVVSDDGLDGVVEGGCGGREEPWMCVVDVDIAR